MFLPNNLGTLHCCWNQHVGFFYRPHSCCIRLDWSNQLLRNIVHVGIQCRNCWRRRQFEPSKILLGTLLCVVNKKKEEKKKKKEMNKQNNGHLHVHVIISNSKSNSKTNPSFHKNKITYLCKLLIDWHLETFLSGKRYTILFQFHHC